MSQDTLDALVKLIGNLGFPIFVSIYLLTRVERAIKLLTENLSEMQAVMQHCAGAPVRPIRDTSKP